MKGDSNVCKKKTLFGLFFLLAISAIVSAAPASDLNLTLVNSPPLLYKDLNFSLTWTGNADNIYWQFAQDVNSFSTSGTALDTNTLSDFESGGIPGWVKYTGSADFNATTDQKHTGTYSMQGASDTGYRIAINQTNDYNVSFWIRFTAGGGVGSGSFFGFGNAAGGLAALIRLDESASNKFRVFDGGSYGAMDGTDPNIQTDKWYKIVFTKKEATSEADVYVFDSDGTTVLAYKIDVSLTNNYWDFLIVYADKDSGITYVDDVENQYDKTVSLTSPQYDQNSYSTAGDKNIFVTVENNDGNATTSLTITIPEDTTPPVIETFDINATTGFGVTGKLNYTLRCTDNLSTNIDYNLTNQGVSEYSNTDSNNEYVYLNDYTLRNGTNNVTFRCTDPSGNSTIDTNTFSGTSSRFYFVYDHTGGGLTKTTSYTLADINTVIVYSKNLQSYLNLTSSGDVNFNYSGLGDDSLEIVLSYTDPAFPVTRRYFDVGLLDVNNVPVCFSNLQTFYQQLLYSSSEKDVRMKNSTTGCYILSAATTNAYLDSFSISGWTVPQTYSIYTINDGNAYDYKLLALIDGGATNTINLDLLQLKQDQNLNVKVVQDLLSVAKSCGTDEDCNTMKLVYKNYLQENESITFTIYNGATQLYTISETDSPNDISLFFNFTTWGVSDQNLLIVQAEAKRTNGDTDIITRYFTTTSGSSPLYPWLAIGLAFFLFIGGVTLVAARFALGYFGLMISLVALIIITMGTTIWQVTFMQGVFLVALVYIGLITKNENAGFA